MKKTLLALCAGVALTASAETFQKGEAFVYAINPDFSWFDNDAEKFADNDNWPALMMKGGADMAECYGMPAVWFAQKAIESIEEANEMCPVVADPWNEGAYAIKMQAPTWWAYGNFNFALPQVNEVCRIRVIYRVEVEGYAKSEPAKPFHVRLTNNAQDDCFTSPIYEETVASYWDEEGYRVVDLYYNLPTNQTYLALTFDGAGLSCGGNKPGFYLEEVSVVPVSKLAGNTHVTGDVEAQIVADRPELTIVDGINSIQEINAAAEAGNAIYDMQGRRVANATRGLYIVNGVKTLVK
ncbi:MAG: hypothetical protein HDS04_02760 [Bacteroides sp.]|nr:hypothetical protein [Bacteroides sp.]